MCDCKLQQLDEHHLQRLVLEAQQCSFQSLERKQLLDRIVPVLLKKGFLYPPRCPYYIPHNRYLDLLEIARQEFCREFVEKEIDKYDPERGGIRNWLNFLFSRRFRCYIKQETSPIAVLSLDELTGFEKEDEKHYQEEFLLNQFIRFCEEDPTGFLQRTRCCINNCQNAKLQVLILKKYQGASWQDIAQEVNCSKINENTIKALSQCYCRHIEKLKYLFRDEFN